MVVGLYTVSNWTSLSSGRCSRQERPKNAVVDTNEKLTSNSTNSRAYGSNHGVACSTIIPLLCELPAAGEKHAESCDHYYVNIDPLANRHHVARKLVLILLG